MVSELPLWLDYAHRLPNKPRRFTRRCGVDGVDLGGAPGCWSSAAGCVLPATVPQFQASWKTPT